MEAAKAQNWAVEPQGKEETPMHRNITVKYRLRKNGFCIFGYLL
jgi:hypothetical protein